MCRQRVEGLAILWKTEGACQRENFCGGDRGKKPFCEGGNESETTSGGQKQKTREGVRTKKVDNRPGDRQGKGEK